MAEPTLMTSLRPARRFDWNNLSIRAASTVVLAPLVVLAIYPAPLFFLVTSVAVALMAIEWGQMSAPKAPLRLAATVAVSVLLAVFTGYSTFRGHWFIAWALAVVGALVAAFIARNVSERRRFAALGVIYIGAPCIALTWLRATSEGFRWTVLLFAVTWSADICAYAAGSIFKGPKLWPRFSPNKTWSGFLGGLIGAMGAAMAVVALTGMSPSLGAAALMGFFGGLATMAGDLWESMLKRRFGVKDSGDLIPGHGGLLDRVDGLLFAVMAIAGARLIYQVGWAH
jgi:phosphatidate cytidylyltransferase